MLQQTAVLLIVAAAVCTAHFKGLGYIPHVGNVAIGRDITSTSTCGVSGPEQYCTQDTAKERDDCSMCEDDHFSHPPSLMTDAGDSVHYPSNRTWWQSQTNTSNVQIQLDFSGTFFFSHVIISFKSRRPAAMILYKSVDDGSSFQELHYYAADCEREFGTLSDAPCTSQYSDPSPGEVLYQTDSTSSNLSDPDSLRSLLITNLRLELLKFHPFTGIDADIQDPQIAVRQFYAIYNIEVLGWCFCNGLENNCSFSNKELAVPGMVPSQCSCGNNTTGNNCQECLPLYNDSPWRNGFSESYKGCPDKCNCSNKSDACFYDADRSGGVCVNCTDNASGMNCQGCAIGYYNNGGSCTVCDCSDEGTVPNSVCSRETGECVCRDNVEGNKCETCKNGFFNLSSSNPFGCQACSCPSSSNCESHTGRCPCSMNDTSCCPFDQYSNETHCISCSCSVTGSYQVCTEDGECVCKPGVGGRNCDICLSGYHSLSSNGCQPCSCNPHGSINPSTCDPETGKCTCLSGVEGDHCDRCPPRTLGPVKGGALTCIPCFCNGYSSVCRSSSGWYWSEVSSRFENESISSDWLARNAHAGIVNGSFVARTSGRHLRVDFPSSFLSDKRTSYGQYLSFNASLPTSSGNKLNLQMFTMINHLPSTLKRSLDASSTNHKIPLLASGFMQRYFYFMPATKTAVHKTLANILWMRIEVEFGEDVLVGERHLTLSQVALPYATNDLSSPHLLSPLLPAIVAEDCSCPHSRTGSVCDRCSNGYSLDPARGGEFAKCVRCYCHGLADTCDPVDNTCINCRNNTKGTHCTECTDGYYWDLSSNTCKPCSCPGQIYSTQWFAGSCRREASGVTFECLNCKEGFEGKRCQKCQDGYTGNPLYQNGTCRICQCTNNSAGGINTCDPITARCSCDDGYTGTECEFCRFGYFGNAPAHDCKECDCHPEGSISTLCDIISGQCTCRSPNIIGRECNECASGYWNISASCSECNCSITGTLSNSTGDCHKDSGQCQCKEGYVGRSCSQCSDGYWNNNGTCIDCGCNAASTVPPICNKTTGHCLCLPGVTGSMCSECSPSGNTGILPFCELCDECSNRWIGPIDDLENSTMTAIERADSLTVTNVTHTEVNEGIELVQPLLMLLSEIENLFNLTDFKSLLIQTNETHVNVINIISRLRSLIDRAEMTNEMLQVDNSSFTEQREQVMNIHKELVELCELLSNLTREKDGIELRSFDQYVNRINQALSSSNQSSVTVNTTVAALLNEAREQINESMLKEMLFLNISEDVIGLLDILKIRLSQYQGILYRADKSLCGRVAALPLKDSVECGCYDSNACEAECGGIGCNVCGVGDCNSTVNDVQLAVNVSTEALERAKRLKSIIEQDLQLLLEANTSSSQGLMLSTRTLERAQKELRNISRLLVSIQSFTGDIRTAINASLPNISAIESLMNETLSLRMSKTPEEVLELLQSINETINKYPDTGGEDDLQMRAEAALNNTLLANLTLHFVLDNVSLLSKSLDELVAMRDHVKSRLNQTKMNMVTLRATMTETTSLLNIIERNISSLHERVRALNQSFQDTKNIFEINRRNLTRLQALSNETSKQVLQLNKTQTQIDANVSRLVNITFQRLSRANEDQSRAERLRERMKSLRIKAHDQLLESRRLQNRKTCILKEQEKIRDDIKRVSAELETLHRDIRTEIGRNTICMKKLITGKK